MFISQQALSAYAPNIPHLYAWPFPRRRGSRGVWVEKKKLRR
jgi:hypothetical protein